MTEFPETQSLLLANIQAIENREAWEEFVLLYRPVIYRMARRRGMQDSDAQDLTQDVLLRIARSIEKWESRPDVRFRHWLRKVANNAILSALTKSNRQHVVGAAADQWLEETPETSAASQELQNECLREQYQRAAAIVRSDVSPATWKAFEMTVVQGMSCEQAAESLSKSIGTIYASRSRILKRLQQEVRRFEGEIS
ncbi:MAG: sigma-70 family RNA polymerase sigma factor [Pirellulaceae bacterium]